MMSRHATLPLFCTPLEKVLQMHASDPVFKCIDMHELRFLKSTARIPYLSLEFRLTRNPFFARKLRNLRGIGFEL